MGRCGVLLIACVLIARSTADVEVGNNCGKTLVVGEYSVNGLISLYSNDGNPAPRIPEDCEVTIEAGKGLSLHLRLLAINTNCDEVIQVAYEQTNTVDEVAFFSYPHFCGKAVEDVVPIPLEFDEQTSRCKIRFSRGSENIGKQTNFLFDYSTRPFESNDDLIWPAKPPTVEADTTTPTKVETTNMKEESTTEMVSEAEITTANLEATTMEDEVTTAMSETTAAEVGSTTAEGDITTAEVKASTAEVDATTAELDATTDEGVTTAAKVDTTIAKGEPTTAEADATAAEKEATAADSTTIKKATTMDISKADTTMMNEKESTTAKIIYEVTTETPIEKTTRDFADASTTADEPELITTKSQLSTKSTKPPPTTQPPKSGTTLQCTCSLGFEKDGSHQLLRDFPNALPENSHPIEIPAEFDQPCVTAQQKCANFCKLFVTTRVSGIGGLRQVIVRRDFLKLLKLPTSTRPKLQGTIGEFVCEDYRSELLGDGAELHVFSHLPECGFRPNEVHLLEKNFCCDGKGNHVKCGGPPRELECKCMLTVFKNYEQQFIGTALPTSTILTVPSTDNCETSVDKCKSYCKQTNQYRNLLRSGANTYSYTSSGTFSSSFTGKSVGDRICAAEKNIYLGNRAKLYVTADLKTCTNLTNNYVSPLDNGAYFCCSNKRYAKCDASHTSPTKKPIYYTTKSTPKYTYKYTTKPSTIRCQCVPVHLNGTRGDESRFSAAYTTTVAFTKGCYSAQQLCKQSCTRLVVQKVSGLPLNTNLVNGIKNNVCRRIYNPVYANGMQSQLKLYSVLDNYQCRDSQYRSFIRTLDSNFCCSGGPSSYYRSCKPSTTYRPSYTTYRPSYTTYRPAYNSTYRPSNATSRPIYRYSCDCYVGLRYSGYSTIFQNIRASDVSNSFSSKPSAASTGYSCTTFRNTCKSLCQNRMSTVVYAKTMEYTPYGRIGINAAICRKMGRSITKKIDFVVRSKPSLCTTAGYTTGQFYDQNFCCNRYGTTSTCQQNVIG